MKRIILILLFISSIVYGQTPLNEKSDFIQWGYKHNDKILHFIAGAGTSIIVYAVIKDKKKAKWIAPLAAFGIGLLKEGYDECKYKGWDNKDLGATVLGGVAATFIISIDSKKNKKK